MHAIYVHSTPPINSFNYGKNLPPSNSPNMMHTYYPYPYVHAHMPQSQYSIVSPSPIYALIWHLDLGPTHHVITYPNNLAISHDLDN